MFWHLADFAPPSEDGDAVPWRWRSLARPAGLEGIDLIPVVRVHPSAAFFEKVNGDSGGQWFFGDEEVEGFANWQAFTEVQLDFDCPTRLLKDYADFVRQMKARSPEQKISITALASWIDHADFVSLATGVDTVYPMFYDLEVDRAEEVRRGRWHALADPLGHAHWLEKWAACPVPWVAGLPNFSRVSVFASDGRLQGHLKSWNWDELVFHPDLQVDAGDAPAAGVLALVVVRATRLADVALEAGDRVVLRRPDLSVLRELHDQAFARGASGVCWFRLPGPGDQGGWSLAQIATGAEPVMQLTRLSDGRLQLVNSGGGDLPPRFRGRDGPDDRGWKLEVEVPVAGGIVSGSPGQFVRMAAHADPDTEGAARVHPTEARRLTFWFSQLAAGVTLNTGVIASSNEPEAGRMRWRVDRSEWSLLP